MSIIVNDVNAVKLSRLLITGDLDIMTPFCVRKEIANASGILHNDDDLKNINFLNEMVDTINNMKIKDWSWGDIARFVNKNCKWPQRKLLQAYQFLCSFMNTTNGIDKLPRNFTIGEQTPENVYNINACILYSVCKQLGLSCNENTTITQMKNIIIFYQSDIVDLRKKVEKHIVTANRKELLQILFTSNIEPDESIEISNSNFNELPQSKALSTSTLSNIHTHLHNISFLQSKITPETAPGAIALAAINNKIDLSYCQDPVNEYNNLKTYDSKKYTPNDIWFRNWYNINPDIFDLTKSFNPLLPPEYYQKNILYQMLLTSGHSERSLAGGTLNSYYELLQIDYVTENFYPGLRPSLINNHTIINLDDPSTIASNDILCYGLINNSLQCITYDELTEMFRINKNFSSPFKRDTMFNDMCINKLKILARSHPKLLKIIADIENYNKHIDPYTRQLIEVFHKCPIDEKENIYQCLMSLLHLGMYMRGWRGPPMDYPLNPGLRQKNAHSEMEIRVNAAISIFEQNCTNLRATGNIIQNLPLVKCVGGEYCLSTEPSQGLTIGERIYITKLGEQTDNMSSCVRLTSNWLCGSAHKYLILLGFPPPFNIDEINQIS